MENTKKRGRPAKPKMDTNVIPESQEQRKRGRPAKPKMDMNIALEQYEQKKRGRKAVIKLSTEVNLSTINPELSVVEQLKQYAIDVQKLDALLNIEPYRMDMRMKRQEIINTMCFLIKDM
jgi:hypothetical protein